ncbi:hypothetical protein BDV18DRAFT_134224 [Aspergillus unguis]
MTVSHLVRRGVEAVSTGKNGEIPRFEVEIGSPWLATLLFITVAAFTFSIFSIWYTYSVLIPTLAIVEDSNPDLYIRVDNDPANKNPDDPNQAMEVETAPKPITSKLRTTIRHLRARAGRLSRFRGFSMFLTCAIAEGLVSSVFPVSSNSVFGRFIVQMIVSVLLANLQVAWVHIMISEPSSKRFYQRIPSIRSMRKIIPAAAFEHLLTNGAFFVTLLLFKLIHGLKELDLIDKGDGTPDVYRKAAGMYSIAAFVGWLASFPARVVFIRVAASMLPQEDETIVPFDRSFGGKVAPEVVGGGVVSIKEALLSFGRDGWKRYVKALVKAMGIQVAVAIFFSLAITAEILGGALTMVPKKDDN